MSQSSPATPAASSKSLSQPSLASAKKGPTITNTIGLYAVQCGECFKWRLISNEDDYEDIRCKLLEEPFTCSKKPNASCNDPADIEKDATRTWVIDKPNIPKTPHGFKRKLVLRRDFSKLDAHYVTPTWKKVRSSTEVSKYLDENPDIKGVAVAELALRSLKSWRIPYLRKLPRKNHRGEGRRKVRLVIHEESSYLCTLCCFCSCDLG